MLSENKLNQPANFFIKNHAKNLEFFIFFKKRPKDDLNMARKHFPTLSRAYQVGEMVTKLELFSTLGALVTSGH